MTVLTVEIVDLGLSKHPRTVPTSRESCAPTFGEVSDNARSSASKF